MQLIGPDILTDLKELALGWPIAGAVLGFSVYLTGWKWHRFWIAFSLTGLGGIIGLLAASGPGADGSVSAGHNVLAAAMLLAIAVGLLAQELARILMFLVGGVAVCYGVQQVLPNAQALGVIFLVGGLSTILLYRFWIIAFSSAFGALIFWHCALVILGEVLAKDMVTFAENYRLQCNAGIVVATILGMMAQMSLARWAGAAVGFTFRAAFSPANWIDFLRRTLRLK